MITDKQKKAISERLNGDLLIGRYIDFLIELAPTASDPIAIMDRIERATGIREQLEADLRATLEEEKAS